MRQEILNWFNSTQDWKEGMSLLQAVSRKDRIIGKLAKRGDTPSGREKLIWELNKVAGLKIIPQPQKGTTLKTKAKSKAAKTLYETKKESLHLAGGIDINTLPVIVRRIIHEYSELYKLRGVTHKKFSDIGEDNSPGTIKERKLLIDKIKEASARMEILYAAWKRFEADGTLPEEIDLWKNDQGVSPEKSINTHEKSLIVQKMSIDELKKEKKNIIASLTKDRNLLLYSTKIKPASGEMSPIPEGPKRLKIEKRVVEKKKRILEIDYRIVELG